MNVKVRKANLSNQSDRSFVVDPWLKGWKRSPFAGIIPNNLFNQVFFESINQLLERGMEVHILESVDPENQIGFVAFERASVPVLHYVYVKPVLRGMGFFPRLLEAADASERPFLYTYRTPDCRKFRNGSHCPALARRKNLEPIYAESPGKRS